MGTAGTMALVGAIAIVMAAGGLVLFANPELLSGGNPETNNTNTNTGVVIAISHDWSEGTLTLRITNSGDTAVDCSSVAINVPNWVLGKHVSLPKPVQPGSSLDVEITATQLADFIDPDNVEGLGCTVHFSNGETWTLLGNNWSH